MDFTTILQIKLALGLSILIAVYLTCISLEKGVAFFKHCIRKVQCQIHLIKQIQK